MHDCRIGLLTRGGDCSGLNAVLVEHHKSSEKAQLAVTIGFKDGSEGHPTRYMVQTGPPPPGSRNRVHN